MLSGRFSFFSGGDSNSVNNSLKVEQKLQEQQQQGSLLPSIKLVANKDVYRPGDPVVITIEICNPSKGTNLDDMCYSLLVERLSFEVKGIEKLDTQWFATQKPFPGSKQRRGEHVFLDSSAPTIFTNQIISAGTTKSYIVRTTLPSVIPPSYKGSTIRYLYYAKSILSGRWLILENGHSQRDSVKDLSGLEGRIPLQVWVDRKSSGLETEGMSDEIVPSTTIQMDVFWKEMDGESDWVRAIDNCDCIEDDYESSRDEISSVSSFNLTRGNLHRTFSSSLSLQSPKSSNRDSTYLEGGRPSLSSRMALPQLSVAEELYDYGAGGERKLRKSFSSHNDPGISTSPGAGAVESAASEGFIHGRSYNIRLDKQVLLKFSPRNSDSTYYFSDTIGGTLTFFHEEGAQRCLEVSITLETSETVSRRHVHPSRRNSPTITKVQSDHYEVVADLLQTSFLFSIPMDGPMSFSTPHVSVQWVLRFEFFTTPKNVDWTRYEHPLLIEGREKCEWILPITVHAPPPGASMVRNTKEKPLPLDPMWVQN